MMVLFSLLLTTTLPMQPAGKCVLDEAHGLSSAEFAQLEASCEAVDKSGDGQIEIVLTDDFRGGDKEEFSNSLFHAWGIGHKGKDDGVLVVLSPKLRKWRIEVGYGLEGRVNDAAAFHIGTERGVPEWRIGHWGAGLIPVVSALAASMYVEARTTSPTAVIKAQLDPVSTTILVLLFVLGLAFLLLYIRRRIARNRAEADRRWRASLDRMVRSNTKPYIRERPTPLGTDTKPLAPTPPAPVVVVREPEPYVTPDTSSSYDSSSSSSSSDSGSSGFDGGGGGSSGGGGAGGDF